MSVSVDLQSQLLQYIKAMKKPLLFVAKNDYASIGAVRDLGPTLITVLEKAQELPFSSAQKDLLASVRDAFQSYETQAVEAKIACIASGLQSLRDLERLLSAPPSPTRADRTEASQSSQPRSAAPARTSSARLEERGGPTKDRIPPSRIKDEAALRPEAARQEGADERRKPESTETGRDDATRRTDRNRDVKGVVSREQRPTPAPANRSNQKTEQRPAEKVFQSAPYKERGDQDPSWGRLRREAAPELEPLFFLPLPDEDDPLAETTETVTTPPPREAPPKPHRGREPQRSRENRGVSEASHDRRVGERSRPPLAQGSASGVGPTQGSDRYSAQDFGPDRKRMAQNNMTKRRPPTAEFTSKAEGVRSAVESSVRTWPLPPDLAPYEELIDEYVPETGWSRFGLPPELTAEFGTGATEGADTQEGLTAGAALRALYGAAANSSTEYRTGVQEGVGPEGDSASGADLQPSEAGPYDSTLRSDAEEPSLFDEIDSDGQEGDAVSTNSERFYGRVMVDGDPEWTLENTTPDPEAFYGVIAHPQSSTHLDLDVEPPDLDELRNFDSIPAAEELPTDDGAFSDSDSSDSLELDAEEGVPTLEQGGFDDEHDLEDETAAEADDEFSSFELSTVTNRTAQEADLHSSGSALHLQSNDSEENASEQQEDAAFLDDLSDDLTIHEVMAEVVERAAWGSADATGAETETALETPLTHASPQAPAEGSEQEVADGRSDEQTPTGRSDTEQDEGDLQDSDPLSSTGLSEEDTEDDGLAATASGDASLDSDSQAGDGDEDEGDGTDASASESGSDETRRRGRRRRRRRKGGAGEGEAATQAPTVPGRDGISSGLATPLSEVPAIGPRLGAILEQQGLKRIQDLLYFFPRSWVDRRLMHTIRDLTPGMNAVFQATIDPAEVSYSEQGRLLEVRLVDVTGSVLARWPNVRSNYLRNRFRQGAVTIVSGQVEELDGEAVLINPEVEILGTEEDDGVSTGRIVPLYPPLEGLGQKTLRRLIHQLLSLADASYLDPIPPGIRQRQQLRPLGDALREIHFPPDSTQMVELEKHQTRAWKTLAFHRLMALQLGLASRRKILAREVGRPVAPLHALCSRLLKRLPPLLDDQRLALEDIKRDMMAPHPMARLLHAESRWRALEVAAGAIALALESGSQAAFIVPNELLVEQYAEALSGLLKPIKIELEVLTGSTRGKPREKILGRLRKGEARFVLGTHVLLQDGVQFRNLGLVVLDEHRRMGMLQRRQLFRRGVVPDLLVLASDPMPRVILQSVYGDITWSTLQGMGHDACPLSTQMVVAENREECEVAIRSLLTQGRQLYYVSPEPADSTAPSTQRLAELATRLGEEVFPGTPVGWLHPRMPSSDQDETLKRFRQGQLKVLVTASEPDLRLRSSNAAVMVIERADQLGLVETHAIRSLLTHSFYPATCYLVPSPSALPEDVELLRQLEKETSGMTLAELELQSSGVPDALGIRQLNLTASISTDLVLHGDLMDSARTEAFRWMDDCPDAENPEVHRPLLEFARMQWPQLFEASAA